MKAFGNKIELKRELKSDIKRHIERSHIEIEKIGLYQSLLKEEHEETALNFFSRKYQIDPWYVRITNNIFYNLPEEEINSFLWNFYHRIPVKFNFTRVKSRFFWLLLEDQKKFVNQGDGSQKTMKKCRSVFENGFFERINETGEAEEALKSAEYWISGNSAHSKAYLATVYELNCAIQTNARPWSDPEFQERSAADCAVESIKYAAEAASKYTAKKMADLSPSWKWRSVYVKTEEKTHSEYYIFIQDILFAAIEHYSPYKFF